MASAATLTPAERQTLNDAMEIIGRHTPAGASWQFDSARYRDLGEGRQFFGVTYFDSNEDSARGQHSALRGATFADKIQAGIEIEAKAAAHAEANRAARLQSLRAELTKLEQAA